MRMQLIRPRTLFAACALAIALAASPRLARADGDGPWHLAFDTAVYTDTDNVIDVSPQLAVHRSIDDDGGEVRARATVDVVSAASVDVISQATVRFTEPRIEISLGASKAFGEWRPSLDYRLSTEPDYLSNGLRAGVQRRLGSPDSVLALGWGSTYDVIGRAGTPYANFSQTLWSHGANVSLTQVLGENTLVRVVYSLTLQQGYMEKVYRYVPLFDAAHLASAGSTRIDLSNFDAYRLDERVPEAVPDTRVGHALAVRGLQYLRWIDGSARLDYQLYVDSWGVLAQIVEPAIAAGLGRDWTVTLYGRFYHQLAASFWQRLYVVSGPGVAPRWRTLDRELSPYFTATGGVRIEWLNDPIGGYLEAAVSYTTYSDFMFLTDRTALIGQLGVRWSP